MKKNITLLAFIATILVGMLLDFPTYIVGGIGAGFSLRWFTFITKELIPSYPLHKGIEITGYSLMLVVAGGVFEIKPDDSYLTILLMMGSASIGIIFAELLDKSMQTSKS
ncbi:hypothetical protein OH460_08015 [Vibrio sp. Makdt]|uniref:hypothetical protein n=1 Tax=Vibrio sp. Makdt TaxID=2998828 RepID=UPI0022CD3060|nr:hypothetical protein [Vibrio sp. Makdt]MDA0152243.1 hypothetical protein [Vibrio sp. Makdt]